jgi:hypothetical protein
MRENPEPFLQEHQGSVNSNIPMDLVVFESLESSNKCPVHLHQYVDVKDCRNICHVLRTASTISLNICDHIVSLTRVVAVTDTAVGL